MSKRQDSKQAKQAPARVLSHVITGAARPAAGSQLASYTAAWLSLSGMIDGKAVPAEVVRAVAGPTAFGYHTRNGNFERTDKGVILTAKGEAHFATRPKIQVDPEMLKAYEEILSTGKPDGNLVKNPEFISPLKK